MGNQIKKKPQALSNYKQSHHSTSKASQRDKKHCNHLNSSIEGNKIGFKMTQEQQIEQQTQMNRFYDQKIIRNQKLYQVPLQKMGQRLHKFIGALTLKYRNIQKIGNGTGILVSQNLVLACAHNLFNHKQMLVPSEILFYPGQTGILERPYKVEKYWFPEAFKDKNTIYNDYSLLKLKDEVNVKDLPQLNSSQNDNNFIKLRDTFNENCLDQQIAIYGYSSSAYKQTDSRNNTETVNQTGLIRRNKILKLNTQTGKIEHCISTEGGQSGSPLISINNYNGRQLLHIIGIHKGGAQRNVRQKGNPKTTDVKQVEEDEHNIARLITASLITNLKQQAIKWNAKMFLTIQAPLIMFKKTVHPQISALVKYSLIRQQSCQQISTSYLNFSAEKAKNIYFLLNNKVYFPSQKFCSDQQLQALISYYDAAEPIQALILEENDLFYHQMKQICRNLQLEQKAFRQFQKYIDQKKRIKVASLAQKSKTCYFKDIKHVMPLYAFTLALFYGEYPRFLAQLTIPIKRQSHERQIFVPMTAFLVKHAQKLPIYKGLCYNLINYSNCDWEINEQIIIKTFMSCLIKKQSSPAVVSRFEEHSILLQIQSLSSRVFYQVSSKPSKNQVIFLPFTVFQFYAQRQETICKNRRVKVLCLREIKTRQHLHSD